MFSYQGSCLCSVSSDSFNILPKSVPLCQELFYFSLLSVQATAYLDYHITSFLSTTFFKLFRQHFSLRIPVALQSLAASVLLLPYYVSVVFSDVDYLIIKDPNCQCFFSFLFISHNLSCLYIFSKIDSQNNTIYHFNCQLKITLFKTAHSIRAEHPLHLSVPVLI